MLGYEPGEVKILKGEKRTKDLLKPKFVE